MTTVGIIGSGMIGGTVARLSVAAGYHVVVSNSRGPETLAELAAELARWPRPAPPGRPPRRATWSWSASRSRHCSTPAR